MSKVRTEVLKVEGEILKKMVDYYLPKRRIKTPPYAILQADEEDTVVTIYNSGKVMFQGISADVDANMWKSLMGNDLNETKKNTFVRETDEICPNCGGKLIVRNGKFGEFTGCSNYPKCTYIKERKESSKIKKAVDTTDYYNITSIGSDEVGTGDFFGPIVVCATYIKKEDIKFLESLKIRDTKKMSDETILKITPQVMDKIDYEVYLLDNNKFNKMTKKGINMNAIKALMHNHVFTALTSRHNDYDYVILDQFASEKNYFNYIKDEENIFENIKFMTKAEDKNMAVACGALISRYTFLTYLDKLGEKYDTFFPKGASNLVDEFAINFIKRYGFSELNNVAKTNFKNIDKIKELLHE